MGSLFFYIQEGFFVGGGGGAKREEKVNTLQYIALPEAKIRPFFPSYNSIMKYSYLRSELDYLPKKK